MTEQNISYATAERAASSLRSQLLTPVVEGNTLERDDVAGFLSGRLSNEDDGYESPRALHLS